MEIVSVKVFTVDMGILVSQVVQMSEAVKRKTPGKQTLRELFLRSGNQCAFPGCHQVMIDDEGNFVGQICHIEAADEGGERFNPKQTNEQRASVGNLMLMCYPHHVTTNDVNKYPVSVLMEMKNRHEGKYSDAARKIGETIADYTEAEIVSEASNLRRLRELLDLHLTDEDLLGTSRIVRDYAARLKIIPRPTRQVLSILIKRSKEFDGVFMSAKRGILTAEVLMVCDGDNETIVDHLRILEQHDFITVDYEEYYGMNGEVIAVRTVEEDWDISEDLLEFSKLTGIALEKIIVDLDFSVLDEWLDELDS